MRGALLIVNPTASRVTPELTAAVEAELRGGGPVETVLTERAGHAIELAEEGCRSCERIYVYSGDGGFNEAVNGMDGRVLVGFLPGGATSVLTRALGLPRDPVECARALARSHRLRRISLGRVNFSPTTPPPAPERGHHLRTGSPPGSPTSRRFTFSAGVGLDAELVRAVDEIGRAGGGRPGDFTYVWALLRMLGARRGRLEPAMTVVGAGRVAFAIVANCDPYSYVGRLPVRAAPEARFELGLDLVAPTRLRARQLPRIAYWVLVRPGQTTARDIVYVHDADELRIECDRPTPLQVDGEDLGDVSEALFEAERSALDVIV